MRIVFKGTLVVDGVGTGPHEIVIEDSGDSIVMSSNPYGSDVAPSQIKLTDPQKVQAVRELLSLYTHESSLIEETDDLAVTTR